MLRRNPSEFINKLRSLSRAEVSFAGRAWLLAPVVEASLALRGLKSTLSWLQSAFPLADPLAVATASAAPTVERAKWLVDNACRLHLIRGRCLPRSLVQYALMRKAGSNVRLVIGVDHCPVEQIKAHAWVKSPDGTAGGEEGSFQPLMVVGP